MKESKTLWLLIIILIFITIWTLTGNFNKNEAISNMKYNDDNFKYAVSHKVNTLSHVYGDISWRFKQIANDKMTIKEFEQYNYGVNRFIQANNFRLVETILFEDNNRLYKILLDINRPIVHARTIVKNTPKTELYAVAEIYSSLKDLTSGNNKKSLSYYILNDDLNEQGLNRIINEIEALIKQLSPKFGS